MKKLNAAGCNLQSLQSDLFHYNLEEVNLGGNKGGNYDDDGDDDDNDDDDSDDDDHCDDDYDIRDDSRPQQLFLAFSDSLVFMI